MPKPDKKVLRVIDANFNRLRDALRVIEDTLRFVYDSPSHSKIRSIRTALCKYISMSYPSLVTARSSESDLGKNSPQKKHKDVEAILRANFSRCSESLRVLEEYQRLISARRSAEMKKIRFALYGAEKKIVSELFKYEK